jgi:hypothetical protein
MSSELRNRTIAPTERLPIVPSPGTGVVVESCEDRTYRYPVGQHVGRMLRIAGFAYLCFDCGPDGGVYHIPYAAPGVPDWTMAQVKAEAERIFLHDGDGSEPPTPAELRAFDADMRRQMGLHE